MNWKWLIKGFSWYSHSYLFLTLFPLTFCELAVWNLQYFASLLLLLIVMLKVFWFHFHFRSSNFFFFFAWSSVFNADCIRYWFIEVYLMRCTYLYIWLPDTRIIWLKQSVFEANDNLNCTFWTWKSSSVNVLVLWSFVFFGTPSELGKESWTKI